MFEQIKRAFVEAYVTPEGKIANDAQGCYALAVHFDLLDETLRSKSIMRLVEGIRRNEYHPTTGFGAVRRCFWRCQVMETIQRRRGW